MRPLVAGVGVALIVALGASASSQQSSAIFSVDRQQAAQVAAVVYFVHYWNARKLDKALALLTQDANFSDCDYRTHRAVILKGRTQIATWLRKRFADRDVLTIGRIWNENPNEDRVAGVDYDRRASRLFPSGTVPKVATKVVFAADGRIRAFANGPGGAPVDQQARICSP